MTVFTKAAAPPAFRSLLTLLSETTASPQPKDLPLFLSSPSFPLILSGGAVSCWVAECLTKPPSPPF